MTQAEMRLIEDGWDALVERLGVAEATRLVMLLDRRTGGALQHLRALSTTPQASQRRMMRRGEDAFAFSDRS
jgi:hypothetical protein